MTLFASLLGSPPPGTKEKSRRLYNLLFGSHSRYMVTLSFCAILTHRLCFELVERVWDYSNEGVQYKDIKKKLDEGTYKVANDDDD